VPVAQIKILILGRLRSAGLRFQASQGISKIIKAKWITCMAQEYPHCKIEVLSSNPNLNNKKIRDCTSGGRLPVYHVQDLDSILRLQKIRRYLERKGGICLYNQLLENKRKVFFLFKASQGSKVMQTLTHNNQPIKQ
jgi:hypothetical protein